MRGGHRFMADLEVTEVRIKLSGGEDKLLGYCSLTFNNAIVIKDIKIIHGDDGPFVAMPSRKITEHCQQCRTKNHLRAKFCNECGVKLPPWRADTDHRGRDRLHFDVVHPINPRVRMMLHDAVVAEIAREQERARNRAANNSRDGHQRPGDSVHFSRDGGD